MILAVLEAHGGLKLGQYDIYLNVAGGLKIAEPAADLAAAAALVSSLVGASLPHDAVYFGEIGLSGRHPARRACGPAAERSGQARLHARRRAGFGAKRRRARRDKLDFEPRVVGGEPRRRNRRGGNRREQRP